MLKHDRIIKRMSRAQKIACLTDENAPSRAEASALGIPSVKSANLSELAAKDGFPSFESLAVSWDADLIYQISRALAAEARRSDRANLFITPDLKCAANPYKAGLSEAACLNGAIGSAIAGGVHADGSACALAKFFCDAEDVTFLDRDEDARAVYELFCKPFYAVMREAPCEAVITSLYRPAVGYSDTNVRLFNDALSSDFGDNVYVICEQVSNDVRFTGYIESGVCFKGEGVTLDRALGRCESLARSAENGSISQSDLQGALSSGIAVKSETADAAVDKIIDHAFNINALKPSSETPADIDTLRYRAAAESIVLLKNQGVLPLASGARVAVIGGSGGFESMSGLNVVAFSEGFADEKDDPVVRENVERAAAAADVIIVFIDLFRGGDGAVKRLSPPVNILKLIQRLGEFGKCMIAVLPSDLPVDASFDGDFQAALAAPLESADCAEALGAVLSGREIPCGKLTRGRYDGADARYKTLKADADAGVMKAGGFGYRGGEARYPFGHGLSYTCFAYSGLRADKKRVSFTIKNVGKCAGDEVAQIYASPPENPDVKELIAFARVHLAAGEKRTVSVNLPDDCFARYDVKTRTGKTFSGIYKIFVGASSEDIRLKGAVGVSGERAEKVKEKDGRGGALRLSSESRAAARKKRAWFKNICITALIAALVAFVAVGVIAYLNPDTDYSTIIYIIGAVFAVAALALLIENYVRRSREKDAQTEEAQPEPVSFTSPVLKTSTPISIFEKAFSKKAEEAKDGKKNKDADEPRFFDRGFTFGVIRGELETFTAERGCKFAGYSLSRLIAAFAASRAVVFPSSAEKQLNLLAPVLSEYFGSALHACGNEFYNDRTPSGTIARAVKAAEKQPEKIHILLYRGINASSLTGMLFAKNAEHAARLGRRGSETDIVIPPNLWVLASLAEGENLSDIPADAAESVGLLISEMTEVEPAVRQTAVRQLGFYQFDNLCAEIRGEYEIDENLWKRIDRFEESLGEEVFHGVGNRTWVKMEKFAAAYLACGGGAEQALDGAVASQLLISLRPVLAEKDISGARLILALEEVFGAENIGCCRKIVSAFFNDADARDKGEEDL